MGSDIVELIKDIVKYLSSGLVEYFLECRVSVLFGKLNAAFSVRLKRVFQST